MNIRFIIKRSKYIVLFLFLFSLCWLFPYTGDDWAWGSSIGIERLNNWFDNYSGRYVGNIIVLLLTRFNFIKSIVMSIVLTGTCFYIEKIINKKWAFWIGITLLSVIPRLIFRQSIVWTSGFSNYATSVFFILIYIAYIYGLLEKNEYSNKLLYCLPLFMLGIINSLIVEHMTLYNIVLAFFTIVYTIIKYRKIFIQHISYLFGTLLGTYIMFSNSVYHSIQTGSDGYRSVAEGGIIKQITYSFTNIIYKEGFMNNICINVLIASICLILYLKIKENISNKKVLNITKLFIIEIFVYVIYTLFRFINLSEINLPNYLIYFEAFFTIITFLSIIITTVLITVLYKKNILKVLFILGSIICLIAPLFVVNPIGSRCFYASYIMFILLICELINIFPEKKFDKYIQIVQKGCIVISLAMFLIYIFIFGSIYRVDKSRLKHIKKCVDKGDKKVEIIHLPCEEYVWTGTPEGEPWITRYKLFYNLPEDIEIKATNKYNKKNINN